MKSLFLGILIIIIVGIGGLVYRNAVEHPLQTIACPLDAEVCPDGTSVSRTGTSCTFPACPPPNVTIASAGISYAVPAGFVVLDVPFPVTIAAYEMPASTSTERVNANIFIRWYTIAASSTALATIQQTAISGTSDMPVNPTSFSSTVLGNHRFTVVSIERFEGAITTAFYLGRNSDVLRFDATDESVIGWTNPNLDISALPAHAALIRLLTTLQGGS